MDNLCELCDVFSCRIDDFIVERKKYALSAECPLEHRTTRTVLVLVLVPPSFLEMLARVESTERTVRTFHSHFAKERHTMSAGNLTTLPPSAVDNT
jgi:hypothetical protein